MVDWSGLAAQKYDILQQHANADTQRASAEAAYNRERTGLLRPQFNAEQQMNAAKRGQMDFENRKTEADTNRTNFLTPLEGNKINADIRDTNSQIDFRNNVQTPYYGAMTEHTKSTTRGQNIENNAAASDPFGHPFGYKRGMARVPGKGSPKKDSVKAKLAPGEAVLNAQAAEMAGRDNIAALNRQGAQQMGMSPGQHNMPGHYASGTAAVGGSTGPGISHEPYFHHDGSQVSIPSNGQTGRTTGYGRMEPLYDLDAVHPRQNFNPVNGSSGRGMPGPATPHYASGTPFVGEEAAFAMPDPQREHYQEAFYQPFEYVGTTLPGMTSAPPRTSLGAPSTPPFLRPPPISNGSAPAGYTRGGMHAERPINNGPARPGYTPGSMGGSIPAGRTPQGPTVDPNAAWGNRPALAPAPQGSGMRAFQMPAGVALQGQGGMHQPMPDFSRPAPLGGGARQPAGPPMPANLGAERARNGSFGEAFKAARSAAGGAGGMFDWHGKQFQTNVRGEAYQPMSKLTRV